MQTFALVKHHPQLFPSAFGEFHYTELGKRLQLLPKLGKSSNIHPMHRTGPWAAGGAVRREICGEKQGGDVDIFFSSTHSFEHYLDQVRAGTICETSQDTERCIELKITSGRDTSFLLDLIKVPFDNLEALFDDFDFTCCQFAVDDDILYASPLALLHAGQKQLRANNWGKMKISYAHMVRYMKEGWVPGIAELDALLADVAKDGTVMQIASKYSSERKLVTPSFD